jgi:carbon-monoxide dehydrogenase medium subunit
VRQVGTFGGNLCFAEPHADPGTLLLALGATLVAEKSSSRREIAAGNFFVDAYETSLESDEVLTEIRVPLPAAKSGVAYLKFGYLERPSVGVAVALTLDGEGKSVTDIGIAVGCAGPAPKRVAEAEAGLKGKSTEEAARNLAKAGEIAGREARAISDLHGSQEYKEHIVGVLLKRAFESALRQVEAK